RLSCQGQDRHDDRAIGDSGKRQENVCGVTNGQRAAGFEKMKRVLFFAVIGTAAIFAQQNAAPYRAPRTPDRKPDLQGIWEAGNTANGSREAPPAALGIRAGESVIVDPADGKIPYQPAARAKQKENFANRATGDPVNRCFLPGVPRIVYLPYAFQIF